MTDQNANNGNADGQNAGNQTPTWWIDEGIPGVGNKPDWLGDKFKSAADMAKSYKELEKQVGFVPEKYDFNKSQYLDPTYAPFQELQDFAKSKRVPQEVFDKMLESVDKYMNEFATDDKEEIAKFGDNAKERLTTLNNWAKANLSDESFVALTSNLRTAESVKALEEIRNKMMSTNSTVPNGNDASASGSTMEEVQAELQNNLDKYKTDPKYRKEIQAKLAAVSKQSDFVDKNW